MKTGNPAPNGLAQRLRWLEARGHVLAGNVANADVPKFAPRDLIAPDAQRPPVTLGTTHTRHIAAAGAGSGRETAAARFETRPSGNAVSLEDEMLKIAETQIEHQTVASLYQHGLHYLKTALGRRG